MTIREKLRAAASVPEVPYWSALVAGLAMAGGRILPEDLWDSIGAFSIDSDGSEDATAYGFSHHENHSRGESHESWQDRMVRELRDANPGREVWFIPVDELVCLAAGDEGLRDMVSVERLSFVGSEEELRSAVRSWLG